MIVVCHYSNFTITTVCFSEKNKDSVGIFNVLSGMHIRKNNKIQQGTKKGSDMERSVSNNFTDFSYKKKLPVSIKYFQN